MNLFKLAQKIASRPFPASGEATSDPSDSLREFLHGVINQGTAAADSSMGIPEGTMVDFDGECVCLWELDQEMNPSKQIARIRLVSEDPSSDDQ